MPSPCEPIGRGCHGRVVCWMPWAHSCYRAVPPAYFPQYANSHTDRCAHTCAHTHVHVLADRHMRSQTREHEQSHDAHIPTHVANVGLWCCLCGLRYGKGQEWTDGRMPRVWEAFDSGQGGGWRSASVSSSGLRWGRPHARRVCQLHRCSAVALLLFLAHFLSPCSPYLTHSPNSTSTEEKKRGFSFLQQVGWRGALSKAW